jgi:hypothetical protein
MCLIYRLLIKHSNLFYHVDDFFPQQQNIQHEIIQPHKNSTPSPDAIIKVTSNVSGI